MSLNLSPRWPDLHGRLSSLRRFDGTNAQINIVLATYPIEGAIATKSLGDAGDLSMFAGSRTRYVSPEDDNFGFARWAQANADDLFELGPGRHFGEWWGQKIQRGYGLTEKRFSLFNTTRWNAGNVPSVISVVPELYRGLFSEKVVDGMLEMLRTNGSAAAPGFMDPEGIVIYHVNAGSMFKKTLKNDEVPKGKL